ncbi:hypothetical protein FQN50_005001 [Emmonsiellopsis sp. PD_5]|nr:hypothetical protein FQN50_005001 [Emmonsiellopsis sp. PD_5]
MASRLSLLRRICSRAYSSRSINTDFSTFQEGDRVIIQGPKLKLTKALKKGGESTARRGILEHDNIIGARPRGPVPSLKDANLIVSLLDIHVAPPGGEKQTEPLEILEAGTGHGSLTLHLSRAINAANTLPPPVPRRSQCQILSGEPAAKNRSHREEEDSESLKLAEEQQQQWDSWRAQRSAILHTVELSAKYSRHAEGVVRGFRRGIYSGNVDFYVSSAEEWVKEQSTRRLKEDSTVDPFLSHVILDMPSAHLRIPHVAPVMKDDAILLVFMPNVTQIGDCVEIIDRLGLPFVAEKVVELGTGLSSGRLWDVRSVYKRSTGDIFGGKEALGDETPNETLDESSEGTTEEPSSPAPEDTKVAEKVLVCRPKVGEKIVGGGFVGVWRKKLINKL